MKKEGKILINITKAEAHKLHEEYGVVWKDEGISHTYSKNGKHYYLCESKYNMRALKELRSKK